MRLAPLLLAFVACGGPAIRTDFEGGSLGPAEDLGGGRFRAAVEGQADHAGRNRQPSWYYFRVDGARGTPVEIALTRLRGEYDYKPGQPCVRPDTPPVTSADGVTWRHLDGFSATPEEATIRVVPETDRLWIAHIEPYPASRLDAFLRALDHPPLKIETIGRTVEGRGLRLITITDLAADLSSKKHVWLMCRQHAWETGTSFAVEGAIRWLLSDEARDVRSRVVFHVFPMMDPDGCARGGVRFNRNGYDLNRNWDVDDARLMPEIAAAKRALAKGPVDLFLTLHNQETGEWMSGSPRHPDVADRLFEALRKRTTFDPLPGGPRPSRGDSPAGRVTVYEYVDRLLGRPGFLLEQGITKGAKLGRLPTADDRRAFGAQLARVLGEF